MFFFQRNWSPFGFFSRSSSFSVIQTLKLSPKKESAFVTKRPGSYAIYRRNARVLEMQNFIPAYTKRWTHVRTYPVRTIFSEPKFLGCMEYCFLPFVLRECASCARELRYYFAQGVLCHFPLPHSISV